MSNPLFQSGHDTPNNRTVSHNSETEVHVSTRKNRSHFNLNHVVLDTLRYGEYHPFICMPVVPKDNITLRSRVNIKSDTLASPLMTGISLQQDYCYIPLTALMPVTSDLALKTPTSGDDVPDDVFPSIPLSDVKDIFASVTVSLSNFFNGTAPTTWSNSVFIAALKQLLIASYLFSNGSLMKTLGYSFIAEYRTSLDITNSRSLTFDNVFDLVLRDMAKALSNSTSLHRFTVKDPSSVSPKFVYFANPASASVETDTSESIFFRSAIEYLKYLLYALRRGLFVATTGSSSAPIIPNTYKFPIVSISFPSAPLASQPDDVVSLTYNRLSLIPVLSYHAMTSTFFVNKNIDKIYTFDLWLANLRAVASVGSSNLKTFSYNGATYPYDMSAGVYLSLFLNPLKVAYGPSSIPAQFNVNFDVMTILFDFDDVLLYGDRFTNCRVRALGIEDNASIALGSGATAVDVTRSVIYQKFKNKVSKLGNLLSSQLGGFFGVDTPPDFHYPQYIGASTVAVNGFEVANTAESLGEQVTRINTSSSPKTGFNVDITYHGYILGLASITVPYAYSRSLSRDVFFGTRWELYNPDFQNLGDDVVRDVEYRGLIPSASGIQRVDSPFGYEGRDNFYKIPISKARGAFSSELRAWAFVIDSSNDVVPNVHGIFESVSPEFLRCVPMDFDRFMVNFGNASPADWYHLIVSFSNDVQAERNMIDDPSISLG